MSSQILNTKNPKRTTFQNFKVQSTQNLPPNKNLQVLLHQPHQIRQAFKTILKQSLQNVDFLLGGGQACSTCSGESVVVENQTNTLGKELKLDDQNIDQLNEIATKGVKNIQKSDKKLKIHRQLEEIYEVHTDLEYVQEIVDNGISFQTELVELTDSFLKFKENLFMYDRKQFIDLSNLMINYLYHKLNLELDKTRQKDINELTTKLGEINLYIQDEQSTFPCLDMVLIFDLLISLNKFREGRDEKEKTQIEKIYKFSLDIIKVVTSIDKTLDLISDLDFKQLTETVDSAQNELSKIFKDEKEISEGGLVVKSWFGQYQTKQLFNCLNILWITKFQKFRNYYINDNSLNREIPVDEEIAFYIQMFSEITLEGSTDVINYILLQIKQLVDKYQQKLIEIVSTVEGKNKQSIKDIIEFSKMLQINGNFDSKFNHIFQQVVDLFLIPAQRYLMIQILIKLIDIDNLFTPNEKKEILTGLCLKFIYEKEESVRIIFMYSKPVINFVQQIQQDKNKQKQLLEENNNQDKLLTTRAGIKAVTKLKEIREKISNEDIDKIILESLIKMWEAGVRSRQHQNLVQHKDDILLDVMQLYVEQSITFKSGNQVFEDYLKKDNEAQQNLIQQKELINNQKSALNQIIKHYLIKNYSHPDNQNNQKDNNDGNKCKILSILAEGGTGKSMFLKKLENVLIRKEGYSQENTNFIPLIIKCNSLDSHNPSIENFLLSQNISEHQIQNLKKSERNKIIMLDGYDEFTGEYFKVYEKLRINEWKNTLVIVTSRLEKISVKDAEIYFNYYDQNGTKGSSSNHVIVQLNKFEAKDIESYFDSFKKEQISTIPKFNVALFEEMQMHCMKNKQLLDLLKLPINLYLITRMITNLSESQNNQFISIIQNASDQVEIQEYFFRNQFEKKAEEFTKKNPIDKSLNRVIVKQQIADSYFEYFQKIAMAMFMNKGSETITNFLQIDKNSIQYQCSNLNNLLSKQQKDSLIEFINNFVDSKVITRVKLSNNESDLQMNTDNKNKQQDQQENIIEFRHKSIFEYFAARAMKYDFDVHKEGIHQLSLDQLRSFNINKKVIINPGQNQSEQQVLIKLYKLIKLDLSNCNYRANYRQNDIKENNRYIQYIKMSRINSSTEVSVIDQGSSNLISALFISKFSYESMVLNLCSFSKAYLTNKRYNKILFEQCNLQYANISQIDLSSVETSNTSQSSINGLQKVFDSNNLYQFNQTIFFGKQLLSITKSGYLNSFDVFSNNQVSLISSKRISCQPLKSITQNNSNQLIISTECSLFLVEGNSFNVIKTHTFQYPISSVSLSKSNFYQLVTLNNSITYLGNPNIGFKQILGSGQKSCISPVDNTLIKVDENKFFVYSLSFQNTIEFDISLTKSLEEHSSPITAFIFSQDGRYFATGSSDHCKVWDSKDQFKLLYQIEYHSIEILSLAFSPNSKYLVVSSYDETCKVWNMERGLEFSHLIKGHSTTVSSLAFTQDGKYLATSCRDNICNVWNTEKAFELTNSLKAHTRDISSVAFSPDKKYLITGSWDFTCKVWNAEKGFQLINSLQGHTSYITSVAFSPDGKYLATCSSDKTCRLWNAKQDFTLYKTLSANNCEVSSVAFSLDGRYFAMGSTDRCCSIWNAKKDFEHIYTIETLYNQQICSVAFSSDGRYLATGQWDDNCIIWDTQNNFKSIYTLQGHTNWVKSVEFSPNGKYLATGSRDKTLKIWNIEKDFKLIQTIQEHQSSINSVTFSRDGKYLATGSDDKTCKLWNIEKDFQCMNTIQGESGILDTVSSVAFSLDGKYLASGYHSMNFKVWNTEKGFEVINSIQGHFDSIESAAFSPNGKYLATGSSDCTCKIWSIENGFSLMNTLQEHTKWIYSVAFSPDGKYLATGSADMTCKIWNTENDFELVYTLEGHNSPIKSVAFSPDGKFLATGSEETRCRIWLPQKGFELYKTISGHSSEISSVAFSPDSKYLATGSWDKKCNIWLIEKEFQLVNTLKEHTEGIRSILFSSNGRYLVTSSYDKTFKLWNTSKFESIDTSQENNKITSISNSSNEKYLAVSDIKGICSIWGIEHGFIFQLIKTLQGHTDLIWSVAFSPDGKYLSTTSQDKSCKIWGVLDDKIETVKQNNRRLNQDQIDLNNIMTDISLFECKFIL